jgi:hypothetical protein
VIKFLFHREEFMAGHMGVNGIYSKLGETQWVAWWTQVEAEAERTCSAFKTYITYGKGKIR